MRQKTRLCGVPPVHARRDQVVPPTLRCHCGVQPGIGIDAIGATLRIPQINGRRGIHNAHNAKDGPGRPAAGFPQLHDSCQALEPENVRSAHLSKVQKPGTGNDCFDLRLDWR